jgi:4-hydroxythreonine-4-phosphate dehydrogenase
MDKNKNRKPVIGITIGDYNGIGPEIIIKTFSDNRMLNHVVPVIYGHAKMMSFWKKKLANNKFNFSQIKGIDALNPKRVNLINCWEEAGEVSIGVASPEAGAHAVDALKVCIEDAKQGKLDGIVTAPINKKMVQKESFDFPGHTEFLSQYLDAKKTAMVMISGGLKVAVLSGHVPLSKVPDYVTSENIQRKLDVLANMLKKQFGKEKPKIAVLGLNPHAGEEGLLGTEEQQIMEPTIKNYKKDGAMVFGPYPADGFFGTAQYKSFDAILAMYHDQGLIPFKTLAFESGVNFTAGLPVPRTSPDHGTAYSIAGKGIANETSFRESVFLLVDIYNYAHKNTVEIEALEIQ